MGGVDNSGAGAVEAPVRTVTVVDGVRFVTEESPRCTMVSEGPEGEEVMKRVTLKNGDVKHYTGAKGHEHFFRIDKSNGDVERYWGSKGAERCKRIDRADDRVETYKGPTNGEWMTEEFMPGSWTVLYGGGRETSHKVLEIDHVTKQVKIHKRDGEGAATSSLLRKVVGGKFYARKSVEDEWEEVEVSEEWLERQSELRKEEKRKRAREEQEEQERKRRREKEAKEAAESRERRRFAAAQFNDRTLVVGSVEGADRAVIGEDYCDTGDPHGGYAPNTDVAEYE